jgi:hypothetical protein
MSPKPTNRYVTFAHPHQRNYKTSTFIYFYSRLELLLHSTREEKKKKAKAEMFFQGQFSDVFACKKSKRA